MDPLKVTVRGINGEVLLGPEARARNGFLSTLRSDLVRDGHFHQARFTLQGETDVIDDDSVFNGKAEVDLVAIFETRLVFKAAQSRQGNRSGRYSEQYYSEVSVTPEAEIQGDPDLKEAVARRTGPFGVKYSYSQSEMPGAECVQNLSANVKAMLAEEKPEESKCLFDLVSAEDVIKVETIRCEWDAWTEGTGNHKEQVLRVSGHVVRIKDNRCMD